MSKWKKNDNPKNYLTCISVKFYTTTDEDIFFAWLDKISCIEGLDAAKNELYLDLVERELEDADLMELIALFARYKIDMKQLARFLNDQNKNWFYNNKKAYWHKKVFSTV